MSVAPEWLGDDLFKLRLDFIRCLAGRKAGSVAYPKHVRVDRERLLAECRVQDDIGGLSSHSRQ